MMMSAVPGMVVTNYNPGLLHSSCPRILPGKWSLCSGFRNGNNPTTQFGAQRRRVFDHGSIRRLFQVEIHVMPSSSGRNHLQMLASYDDDDTSNPEPFWLSLLKELKRSLRSLAVFLGEQPGELKYIEWPSLQSTLKTAMLTLVLVAVLIVALTSVDASLSLMSRLLLKNTV